MIIGVPVDENKLITKIFNAKEWAMINFDEGVVKDIKYIPNWSDYMDYGIEWIDFIVLENRFENAIDFLNEGIIVLARREGQDNIDEIVEGFKFKELDEVGF